MPSLITRSGAPSPGARCIGTDIRITPWRDIMPGRLTCGVIVRRVTAGSVRENPVSRVLSDACRRSAAPVVAPGALTSQVIAPSAVAGTSFRHRPTIEGDGHG
jgi:hypothetical protein